jgi:predicted nuclease of predicted toxin-antitoxin system
MLFIFDENYPSGFVEGFAIIEQSDKRNQIASTVVYSCDFMGGIQGSTDVEIITRASQQNAVIVTQDSDFKRIKHYKPLLIEHKVGYIYFKTVSGKNLYWDIVRAFINKWEELKKEIANSKHPFAFEINKNGHLAKLPF